MDDKRFRINRISEAPQIDGRIDSAEWQEAARISDMHEIEPVEFTAPSERTVWYFAYDDRALYVAGYAYDSEPDQISANVLRQGGNLFPDDRMSLIIDPFNNKRSGYSFTLNPNGVRAEAIYATPTRASDEWDGIWHGAAQIVNDGWTMEMEIPFNTITFDLKNDTWGVNVWRRIARKAERMGWESRNGAANPTVAGEVYGLTGMSQGVGLDIIPSVSSTYLNDRVDSSTNSDFNPSVDISYKITPSINGILTFNTDFAATEVDGRQLEIQRFSLFFPEKRAFFLTDFDIFQFGGVPSGGGFGNRVVGMRSGTNGLAFFSRRIGLSSDRQPVDIIAGGKVSGRIGDIDFGTLYILQDEYQTSGDEFVDQSDLVVTRVSTGVLEESSVGAIFTYGDPGSNQNSTLIGTDFLYRNTRIGANRSAEGRFWLQKSDNGRVDGDDMAWSGTFSLPSRLGLEGGVQIHEVQENFDPALGFANRTGVRLLGGELGYRRNRDGDVFIREVSHGLEVARWEYLDTGNVQSQEISFDYLDLRSSAGDFFRLDFKLHKEGLLPGEQPLDRIGISMPDGEHSFERYGFFFRTASFRKFRGQLRIEDGGYFDGDRLSVNPELEWRPNEHLAFSLQYRYSKYDFPGGQKATTRQITFENEMSFNSKMSLVTLAQYDNVSEDIG
ncbi:MAG: carbohydrate binding family 9 domain-containing protein, partial [Woeseiaceae bacterium]|nr:carbohydrate binding family 9 domain-containing protein [Woeseiaceae bacterium]